MILEICLFQNEIYVKREKKRYKTKYQIKNKFSFFLSLGFIFSID